MYPGGRAYNDVCRGRKYGVFSAFFNPGHPDFLFSDIHKSQIELFRKHERTD